MVTAKTKKKAEKKRAEKKSYTYDEYVKHIRPKCLGRLTDTEPAARTEPTAQQHGIVGDTEPLIGPE